MTGIIYYRAMFVKVFWLSRCCDTILFVKQKILVTGSLGQIGSELVPQLEQKFTNENVICIDLNYPHSTDRHIIGDVTDKERLETIVNKHSITEIYHLAAILSAHGEKNPSKAWNCNIEGLRIVLELARNNGIKVFWPSSIAVFGPSTPKDNVPQDTLMAPITMYGITKLAGELLCQYYFLKYDVDVRSVRFPGIISYKTLPGGGTSDYAVEVFFEGLKHGTYTSFVHEKTVIPMMYMPDALRVIHKIMHTPKDSIHVRTSYTIHGLSFTAGELYKAISTYIPLKIHYDPDFRQQIADSWPNSVDGSRAYNDWGWQPSFGLEDVVQDMLHNLQQIKQQ